MANDQAAIFQPPRLVGDPVKDIVALSEWTFQFYKAVILEGGLATPSAVSAAVDPATATAASAQNTANQALALATAQKVRLDLEVAGENTIADPSTSFVVTFGAAQADTSYFVTTGVAGTTGAPAIAATQVISIVKTVNGFTVTMNAAPGPGNTVTISWNVGRN